MSKSILVIDTPACCGECPMSGTGVCRKWSMKEARTFPKDCPLVEMPERRPEPHFTSETAYSLGIDKGWNTCIDEILKERMAAEVKMPVCRRKRRIENVERLTISGTGEAESNVTIREVLDKLAKYEDLEEQGRLLKPPFMVGDTVYQVIDGCIEPCTVEVIFLVGNRDENGNQQYIMELHYDREDCPSISTEAHFPYHSNRIFPTMEEAENELRRKEGTHEQEKEKPEAE